ncbi:MAG: hypothetical protein ACOC0Z_03580 [Halohasta sp.]
MSVSDALWEIETAIEDAYRAPTGETERLTAHTRRSIYEQALIDVDRIAGSEAMYTLCHWIIREIKTAGRLPASHEVRQVATEICRRTTSANSPAPNR